MELSPLKILIVEDDFHISESLKDILNMLGHNIIGAVESADEAIAICDEEVPELALLDIQISGDLDGVGDRLEGIVNGLLGNQEHTLIAVYKLRTRGV